MSQTITVTLTAACGATGVAKFLPNDELGPMTWDREPEGKTVSARFECIDDRGLVYEPLELDGDDWRELEDLVAEGAVDLDRLPFYCRHGYTLDHAVDAVRDGNDPDGFDAETAHELDELRDRVALCERYSDELDRLEIAPNGDDFNELDELRDRVALCERYSDELDRLEIAPNGDDFNELMRLLQGGAYEAPTPANR